MEKIDKYLETLYLEEDTQMINEANIEDMIKKFTPSITGGKLFKKVQGGLDAKKPAESLSKIKKILPKLPKIDIKTIDKYISSKVPEYKNLKRTSSVVISNSLPGISSQMQEVSSSFLAFSALYAKKGQKITPKENLKKNIKTFVGKVRKFTDDYDETKEKAPRIQKEDIPDLAVAWTVVVMTTALALVLGSGLYTILAGIGGILSVVPGFLVGTFFLALFLILAFLKYGTK